MITVLCLPIGAEGIYVIFIWLYIILRLVVFQRCVSMIHLTEYMYMMNIIWRRFRYSIIINNSHLRYSLVLCVYFTDGYLLSETTSTKLHQTHHNTADEKCRNPCLCHVRSTDTKLTNIYWDITTEVTWDGKVNCKITQVVLRYHYLAPGGGCEVLFSPGLSVCVCVSVCPANILVFDLHRTKVKVTGTVYCFLKVQSYHKNWAIEKFQFFFHRHLLDSLFDETNENWSEQRKWRHKKYVNI